ncbi:MAG: acyl-CoA thioesterase [Anaerolineae bacterium]|nr:acyl-CoA thioesterase [Anaerolineae bacterium]
MTDTALRPFEIALPIPVRTYDIDFAGIVSNIVYIRWLEDLRLAMLDAYFPLQTQVTDGIGPVLVSTQIEYKRPIRLFDKVIGRMWVSELGTTRCNLQAEFAANDVITTTAAQVTVFINTHTMRPVPIPAHLREQYQRMSGE